MQKQVVLAVLAVIFTGCGIILAQQGSPNAGPAGRGNRGNWQQGQGGGPGNWQPGQGGGPGNRQPGQGGGPGNRQPGQGGRPGNWQPGQGGGPGNWQPGQGVRGGGQMPSSVTTTPRMSSNAAFLSNPLVPFFGETQALSATVLMFGSREPVTQAVQIIGQNQQNPNQNSQNSYLQQQQLLKTVRDLLSRNDKNRNGVLDKLNNEWNGLPFDTNSADKNRDGRLTLQEMYIAIGGSSAASLGSAKSTIVGGTASFQSRLPVGVPDWYTELDKDKDGQLTLLEYTGGAGTIAEFITIDKNNDGFITISEMYSHMKKVDDDKRKAEEAAKIEAAKQNPNAQINQDSSQQNPPQNNPPQNNPSQPNPSQPNQNDAGNRGERNGQDRNRAEQRNNNPEGAQSGQRQGGQRGGGRRPRNQENTSNNK